jgi:hypothetical protein
MDIPGAPLTISALRTSFCGMGAISDGPLVAVGPGGDASVERVRRASEGRRRTGLKRASEQARRSVIAIQFKLVRGCSVLHDLFLAQKLSRSYTTSSLRTFPCTKQREGPFAIITGSLIGKRMHGPNSIIRDWQRTLDYVNDIVQSPSRKSLSTEPRPTSDLGRVWGRD